MASDGVSSVDKMADNMAGATDRSESESESNSIDDKYKIPLVFMRETSLFGERRPDRSEWLQHVELYEAIGRRIETSHIRGLQRVRGMWRIYLDNVDDKVILMSEGIPLRGKTVPVLNTNPDRPDGEETTRVRVKNIPLSVDDGIIKRALTLKKIEVISMYREKLRINNKLTNCETGDRIVIVKSTTLTTPLPNLMSFGKFSGRVLHRGQPPRNQPRPSKCTKCLETGHRFAECPNDWVCNSCGESGHKRGECKMTTVTEESEPESETEPETPDAEESNSETSAEEDENQTVETPGLKSHVEPRDVRATDSAKQGQHSGHLSQSTIDKFVTPYKEKLSKVDRSPPTPPEELHDKLEKTKKPKKKHDKSN